MLHLHHKSLVVKITSAVPLTVNNQPIKIKHFFLAGAVESCLNYLLRNVQDKYNTKFPRLLSFVFCAY